MITIFDHRQTCAYCGKGAARHTETIGCGYAAREFPEGFNTRVVSSICLMAVRIVSLSTGGSDARI